jgi:hypothetical protein
MLALVTLDNVRQTLEVISTFLASVSPSKAFVSLVVTTLDKPFQG